MRIRILTVAVALCCATGCMADNLRLWYKRPAKSWVEALPVGNSRMGAMIYGGTSHEELQLNDETFWGGSPYRNDKADALKALPEVRQLIFDGKTTEAQELIQETFYAGQHGMPYQTIGSLVIDQTGVDSVSNYSRELDIERAVATTTFRANGVNFRREVFASLADKVIIVRLTADVDGAINLTVGYTSPVEDAAVSHKGNRLIISGTGKSHEGVPGLVKMQTLTQAVNVGGKVKVDDKAISVTGAKELTLYISSGTNFVNYHDISGNAGKNAAAYLTAAMKRGYEGGLEEHIKLYKKQFDRVSLNLGGSRNEKLETDERVKRFGEGEDMALAALMFQYGRYLLISSSQPGGQPANLQGVWNDKLLAPWDGKYTININTEMNYWPAEVTNLSETHTPLFAMVKELSVTGQGTAKTMYGCRGWVAHHNTDLWRATGPVDKAFYGTWPMGGGWLTTHLWQHYLYTGDTAFLSDVYPALKGAADFYMDYLTEHPRYGWMVTAPSMSPEHGPAGEDTKKVSTIVAGCTMDNQIVFDVLSNALRASQILGASRGYQDSLQNMISRLAPMQIGRHNQLQEWLEDLDNPKDHHRHISHAYGLFPSNQISPYTHPLLFQAVKNTMLQRGDEATGWSIGWKVNLWARLLDGNHALKIISNMLKLLPSDDLKKEYPQGRTYPNLFDAHPPFQIDGNFGLAAGVAEMLMQSHDGAVHILPALPEAWSEGSVKGLVARGGFVVDIDWSGAQPEKVKVTSRLGGNLRLRSYIPLKGDALQPASGDNPNEFYRRADIKPELVSSDITPQYPVLLRIYEYDVMTEPGHTYEFSR
jgi:alpha-L-fucosidase 2